MKQSPAAYRERETSLPLYAQIANDLRNGIASGALTPGTRLPAVTELAAKRGVTAATIRRALKDLTEEGLVNSHVGRGTFVTTGKKSAETARDPETNRAAPALSAQNGRSGAALQGLMALARRPGVIAFTRGIGDPETIEKGTLTRLAHEALEGGEEMFLDYGDPRGLSGLREAVANLYRDQGIAVSAEQVLVTSGSQQALALLARDAAENGVEFLCETPSYPGVQNAFTAFGVTPAFVERDGEGPLVESLPETVKRAEARGQAESAARGTPRAAPAHMLYLCPILHNPTGTDMSAARMDAVADWARRTESVILADEIYRDLHLESAAPPSFISHLGFERLVVLGSLSKSFISGLRVGWIITSEERVRALTAIKKAMDLGCPPLMQGIARAFLENEAGYRAHRERVREHYRIRRDATLAALRERMPKGVSWTVPAGGFQLWVTLPAGQSSVELLARAVDEGVSFLPGPLQTGGDRFESSFRLCYGSLSPEEIGRGIGRLAKALRAYTDESAAGTGFTGIGDI